ncbi:hypothetical protein VTJ83DRAFT_6760 [Remersonia thermophila]|uniref:Methyltransferase type 11 domain-containing protein n=1 Tax=Remersonia thermophila TaxID=72144 RepID=A0ABR4D5M4_9PEZI
MAASSATPSALPSSSAADAVAKLAAASVTEVTAGGSSQADDPAEAYEREHVHGVYEAIAPHFSATRYKPWPAVASFLHAQPPGALGLDVGCGNGKYLGVNTDVFMLASDRSPSLIRLARERCGLTRPDAPAAGAVSDLLVADGLSLPFRERAADFAICVAVIHHLSTRQRRQDAIRQLLRCVDAPRGKVLVYVWALEQGTSRRGWDQGGEQDLLVPWVLKAQHQHQQQQQQQQPKKKKEKKSRQRQQDTTSAAKDQAPDEPAAPAAPADGGDVGGQGEGEGEKASAEPSGQAADPVFQRYYHLYRQGELEEDVLAAGGVVVESGYERDNWWVVAANGPATPPGQQQ